MKCEACEHENIDGARFCANCGAVLPSEAQQGKSLVGQTIGGRFRIIRILGEGGMGVVYEAEQPMGTTIRKVAVKTLHAHLSQDPAVAARFHRECGTVAQLEHPNTIKVYDFGTTSDGTLYIAMEFVAGKSLQQLIHDGGALPPDRVLKIVRQIAGSLAEAHKLGIVHRDLKPENVVLTDRAGESDVVKLLDFGIAARTESADAAKEQKLTQQGMVLGTPPYMSPEQFTGKALDARSDIYSLGVMAYEMLTGRLPFDANTPWQWATEHMTSQPIPFEATPVAAHIPEQMRGAVMRALSKDREKRQPTVTEFYKELSGEGAPLSGDHAARASTGTAAMAAAPDFSGVGVSAAAKTAAMPSPGAGTPAYTPGPMHMPPGIPAPAPPARKGKGLIIGLAGVGGVLAIGMIVVAAQSMKGSDQPPAIPTETAAATTPTTPTANVTAEAPPPTAVANAPEQTAEPEETARPTGHRAKTAGTSKPSTSATGSASSAPSATASGGGTPPTSPGGTGTAAPAGGGGYPACSAAASAGNIAGAIAVYNSSSGLDKAKCAGAVRGGIKKLDQASQCPAVAQAVAAAQGAGISPPKLEKCTK